MPSLHFTLGATEQGGWLIGLAQWGEAASLLRFSKRCAMEARQQRLHWPVQESVWNALVRGGNVVCARSMEGRLLGYYAADQFTHLPQQATLQSTRAARNVLCNRFRFSPEIVSFGAVALIETRLQDSELRLRMLRELLRAVGYRYRCLFNVVEKTNTEEVNAELREGWRCFHEEDNACYMMLDVAKTLRQLASSLVLTMSSAPRLPAKNIR